MKSLPRFECLIRAMCVHTPKDPDMMDTPLSGSRMASGARSDPGLSVTHGLDLQRSRRWAAEVTQGWGMEGEVAAKDGKGPAMSSTCQLGRALWG